MIHLHWRELLAKLKSRKSIIIAKSYINAYGSRIEIGDGSEIYEGCRIYAHADVSIGKNVMMSRECAIVTGQHLYNDLDKPIKLQKTVYEKVVIEDDVWLGYRVIVLPGARIGKGSVIGAGAVVSGEIPPMSVAVGVPAKVIKRRGLQNDERVTTV